MANKDLIGCADLAWQADEEEQMENDNHEGQWAVYQSQDGSYHVIPEPDTIRHENHRNCSCNPTRDEEDAYVWIHHRRAPS